MPARPELTTDLESPDLVRDDAFWRSDHNAEAPQDWLGYLGLDDAEPPSASGSEVPADAPFLTPADPYAALAAPNDDLLPNRALPISPQPIVASEDPRSIPDAGEESRSRPR